MLARTKIAKGGKISIPAVCRKYLNIRDGEEIIFLLKDSEVVISSTRLILEQARLIIKKYHDPNISLVDKLIAERRNEAKNE